MKQNSKQWHIVSEVISSLSKTSWTGSAKSFTANSQTESSSVGKKAHISRMACSPVLSFAEAYWSSQLATIPQAAHVVPPFLSPAKAAPIRTRGHYFEFVYLLQSPTKLISSVSSLKFVHKFIWLSKYQPPVKNGTNNLIFEMHQVMSSLWMYWYDRFRPSHTFQAGNWQITIVNSWYDIELLTKGFYHLSPHHTIYRDLCPCPLSTTRK